jgi:CheY-like chemotaxis protein
MAIKIVCFEDNPTHRERLKTAFDHLDAEFKFFTDPINDWDVTPERAAIIEAFEPNFIIVDLKDDKRRKNDVGLRIIRKLNEFFQDRYPVIAWSVLLSDKPKHQRFSNLVREGGARPLFKSRNKRTSAARFISLASEQG